MGYKNIITCPSDLLFYWTHFTQPPYITAVCFLTKIRTSYSCQCISFLCLVLYRHRELKKPDGSYVSKLRQNLTVSYGGSTSSPLLTKTSRPTEPKLVWTGNTNSPK